MTSQKVGGAIAVVGIVIGGLALNETTIGFVIGIALLVGGAILHYLRSPKGT